MKIKGLLMTPVGVSRLVNVMFQTRSYSSRHILLGDDSFRCWPRSSSVILLFPAQRLCSGNSLGLLVRLVTRKKDIHLAKWVDDSLVNVYGRSFLRIHIDFERFSAAA